MREAGAFIGKCYSYISHIETGRLNFPKANILQRLLEIYGVFSIEDFRKKVNHYQKVEAKKEEVFLCY